MTNNLVLLNEESQRWAKRKGQPWTPEEDETILREWVGLAPADRDVLGVSRKLRRTVLSCAFRASILAGRRLGTPGSRPAPKPPELRYDWMSEWEEETGSAPIDHWQ